MRKVRGGVQAATDTGREENRQDSGGMRRSVGGIAIAFKMFILVLPLPCINLVLNALASFFELRVLMLFLYGGVLR